MLAYVRERAKVRVKSSDRVARPTTDLLAPVERLELKRVALECVDNPALNTDNPQREFMLAAISLLERETISERQAESSAIANCKGVCDRAPKFRAGQVEQESQCLIVEVQKVNVSRDLGVSRQALSAALDGTSKYTELAGVGA